MFDTQVTLVGNVMTAPEWRRTSVTNALVANFKVASSSRRYDRDNGRWVDGPSLRVRVTCWRRLAEGVASSVMVGDPVIVTGRLYTRDWVAEDGTKRASYELEAFAVGHDLARGRGKFARTRLNTATSTVENAESDARIAGETSEPVDVAVPSPEEYQLFDEFSDAELGLDAEAMLREAGLGSPATDAVPLDGPAPADPLLVRAAAGPIDPDSGEEADGEEPGGEEPGGGSEPEQAEQAVEDVVRPDRGRRSRGRVSVPA
jgi:single-strand DNA-binding protein